MRVYFLPLSALERADACFLDKRTADFTAHHGHPPDESSTWAEWCAVLPSIAHRLWTVARVLPLIYPHRREALLRVVVEVTYRAAARAQVAYRGVLRAADRRAAEALVLIRQWLNGEPVSPASVLKALYGYAPNSYSAYAVGYLAYAAASAEAAEAEAAAEAVEATNVAIYAAEAAYRCAAYVADDESAERAQQTKDLDELLEALRLEDP